jgi:hypothetical protein
MDVEPFIQNLSLFFDMRLRILHNFDDAFEIGGLIIATMITFLRLKHY